MEKYFYGNENTVKWHEIDFKEQMRPGAFMNIAQELANIHAANLKFGYAELIAQDQVWVLSRFKAKFNKYPKWQDKIYAKTWHKGKHGVFGLRDFALYIEDTDIIEDIDKKAKYIEDLNNAAIVATSSWVIMNTKTRRIERNNAFVTSEEANSCAYNRNAIEAPCEKLRLPDANTFAEYGSHTVLYSDIDFNLHANNEKYIEWIMDSINIDLLKEREIKELQINYISEAKIDDIIKIYSDIRTKTAATAQPYGGVEVFFVGKREEQIIFEASLFIS